MQYYPQPQTPQTAPRQPVLVTTTQDCDTTLTKDADIGATQLEVASTIGCSAGDLLKVGETETYTIAGIASIMLTTPLKAAHKVGEKVRKVPRVGEKVRKAPTTNTTTQQPAQQAAVG